MADESDRCQRWHKIAIDQLGYALNLILTLAIAALGLCFALLRDKDFVPTSPAKCTMILALVGLTLSAICGLVCAINRLRDFRGTAQRACGNPQASSKDELRGLGTVTWALFYVQIFTFGIGIGFLAVTLLLMYGSKLA